MAIPTSGEGGGGMSAAAEQPWAVVLAGGVGSRFWPLSTPDRPKQLLPLVRPTPLVQDAVQRLAPLVPPERVLVLTTERLAAQVAAALPEVPAANIIREPRPAGTAAALAWGAVEIERRSGSGTTVMISVHADWAVTEEEAFRMVLRRAVHAAASRRRLVTVGVVPTRPETGFGYIAPGTAADDGVFEVDSFVEKPDPARARQLVDAGYLWNSGIFVWRVEDYLAAVQALSPEVRGALAHTGNIQEFFTAVTPIAVDHAVLERSDNVAVIPGAFGWDDVGTWASLHRVRALDTSGNATSGAVHLVGSSGNVVHAERATVVLYGVENLVVVERDGLILVTTRDQSADLKALLDALPQQVRERA
jgi:mannose-1-phosphate guanylyltransferase